MPYTKKDFNYRCYVNVEELHKMPICVYVPSAKLSMQKVNIYM